MSDLAPIALFVHARLEHTKKTINSLKANSLAKESRIYIFCDSHRIGVSNDIEAVDSVRNLISKVGGFHTVKVIYREYNYGLKRNIVEGLDYVLKKHDKVIVLEDDCEAAPNFLAFMNECLDYYADPSKNVWHISGWNPGLNFEDKPFPSYFMSCWGWSTWRYRWREVCFEPLILMENMSIAERYKFNLNGSYPFYSHLLGNYLGQNNTWAVFWYASIFNSHGHCINPPTSLITNLGMDGSGTHTSIQFDQNVPLQTSKKYDPMISDLDNTLKALSTLFGTKQKKLHKIYSIVKILIPIWVLKIIKE
ncbi:sugar transferase [Paraglaciecola sp. 20A4]|uniref:sugar transferase n=1 Tax=Paraglaciecola sp. 20A4 TaxID=2687288 RepID=UPI001409B552|nr:sugar transferase [Paraglaciecola sp. 20A4]